MNKEGKTARFKTYYTLLDTGVSASLANKKSDGETRAISKLLAKKKQLAHTMQNLRDTKNCGSGVDQTTTVFDEKT